MKSNKSIITRLALLQLVMLLETNEESLAENYIVSDCLPLYIEPPPRPDVYECNLNKEQSWHSMNKGKLSKKQRRA